MKIDFLIFVHLKNYSLALSNGESKSKWMSNENGTDASFSMMAHTDTALTHSLTDV